MGKIRLESFQTENLGCVDTCRLVHFYCAFQTYTETLNSILARWQRSFHILVTTVIFVFCAFGIIRYHSIFLVADVSLLGLGATGVLAIMTAVGMTYRECDILDRIEKGCCHFKETMMKNVAINLELYKIAKSFSIAVPKLTYPFFGVNKTTYMVWWSIVIDNVVNALLTF